MKFQFSSHSDQYAKLKLGFIPVLLLVLGYILVSPHQYPDAQLATQKTEAKPTELLHQILTPSDNNRPDKKRAASLFAIPKISLAEISAHDPFELLAVLRPEPEVVADEVQKPEPLTTTQTEKKEPISPEQVKESLKTRLVQGIFISGDKKMVLIDSKVYHEGDYLEEGILIHQINLRHVILELASKERITL